MKICFITYHNWDTKRHGGFHQFAKAAAEKGHETLFFSFARPYYIKWKHEERLNKEVLKKLKKGVKYEVGNNSILNFTFPTLGLPGPLRRFFPYWLNKWLLTHSFGSFSKFCKKWLQGTDCFVFESCEAVLLVEKIKKHFPKAKIIYRPSDPLWEFSNDFFNKKGEARMITRADRILTVNEESIEGYRYKFPTLFNPKKYVCIPNGVDISDYMTKYERPDLLQGTQSACYIGTFLPDWNLLDTAATALPEVRFIIITPHSLDTFSQRIIDNHANLFYIPGISSSDVPKWVTNCDVVIQPFPKKYGHMDKVSLGLTAKNYKAIAANKPIVTYNIPLKLARYGLITTNDPMDFIEGIKTALRSPKQRSLYPNFNIQSRDWEYLCEKFLQECKL